MSLSWKGNIVVTGVSTGLGHAIAGRFIEAGYRVLGSVRSDEDAARLTRQWGSAYEPLIFDVTDQQAIDHAAAKVQMLLDGQTLDLLINNAGVAVVGPATHLTVEDFRIQFEVNFFGVIAVTKTFLPLLQAPSVGKAGKIINVSSVTGALAMPFISPYVASKHALEGWSHSLRREFMIYGIDVILFAPGPIKTPIWDKSDQVSEELLNSVYSLSIKRFRKMLLRDAADGIEAQAAARKVLTIFHSRRPRVRYAMVRHQFSRWIIPRYFLSHRKLDKLLGKTLQLNQSARD